MKSIAMRKILACFLVLLCLGLAPSAFSTSLLVAPGVLSLAKERVEATYALPSQRHAVQILVPAREPHPSSTGGSIVAVLPWLPLFDGIGGAGWSSHELSSAGPSSQPEYQRARSPPHS